MNGGIDAWDDAYRTRKRLWGGAPRDLPGLPPESRVLELGCGNGKSLLGMAGRGWDVTAVDAAPHAVFESRSHPLIPPSVRYVVADVRSLPFASGTFDAVFATHILGHLLEPERAAAARECARVLRNGGLLYFCGFATGDMRCGSGEELEEGTFLRGTGIFTHYFDEAGAAALFSMLTPETVATRSWTMRIRGRDLPRAEVVGVFQKEVC